MLNLTIFTASKVSDYHYWSVQIYEQQYHQRQVFHTVLPINSARMLPWVIMKRLCILVIILPLPTVAKTFYGNDSKIQEFEKIDTKISSTAYVVMYELIM